MQRRFTAYCIRPFFLSCSHANETIHFFPAPRRLFCQTVPHTTSPCTQGHRSAESHLATAPFLTSPLCKPSPAKAQPFFHIQPAPPLPLSCRPFKLFTRPSSTSLRHPHAYPPAVSFFAAPRPSRICSAPRSLPRDSARTPYRPAIFLAFRLRLLYNQNCTSEITGTRLSAGRYPPCSSPFP